MSEEINQNEEITDQQDKQLNEQINEQSTEHLNEHVEQKNEHIEQQNEKDLESATIASEGSGTLKISKDQLDNLIKLKVNNQSQKQFLEIELDDNIFHGKPFRTIYRY